MSRRDRWVPDESDGENPEVKYKRHRIAERSLLSALDDVHLEYLSRQKRIMVAADRAAEQIRIREAELQTELDAIKERELDRIQPEIDRFLIQSKQLKKDLSRNVTHRVKKSSEFIDGENIAKQIKELKGSFVVFDMTIEMFCDKMNELSARARLLKN